MPNWRTGKGVISALQIGEGNKPWRMSLKFLADDAPQGAVAENMTVKCWGRDAEPLAIAEGGPFAVTIEEKPAEGNYPAEWFIKAWNGKDVRQQARGGGSPFKGGGGGGNKGGRPERSPEDTASIVVQTAAKSAEALLVAEMAACAHVAAAQVAVGAKPEKLPAIDPNRVRALVQDFAAAMAESIPAVAAKVRGE